VSHLSNARRQEGMAEKEAHPFHLGVTSGSLDRVSHGDRREDLARAFTEQRPRLASLAWLSGSVADA
jgi:hypothetical protein